MVKDPRRFGLSLATLGTFPRFFIGESNMLDAVFLFGLTSRAVAMLCLSFLEISISRLLSVKEELACVNLCLQRLVENTKGPTRLLLRIY